VCGIVRWASTLLGSTLAVLVDRSVGPDDPDGFPDRAIDWYDISRIDFGVPGTALTSRLRR
jgi:hypothetical protein